MSNDDILLQDMKILVDSDTPIHHLDGKTVLITGATGLLGSQMVFALLYYNKLKEKNIKVVAVVRNEEKAKLMFDNFITDKNLNIVCGDIQRLPNIIERIDYIVHGASLTDSREFIEKPVETIQTALLGSIALLELAKVKKVKSFVYLSSMEIYGVTDSDRLSINEVNYGYIDLLNVRSSYSESKRMVECMCISYASEFKVPVKIARLCQTFGAGVNYNDNRVFAQFARCVIENKDIILHTKGDTVRNYCYTRDAISALIYILVNGESGTAYNVANMNTGISIKDMAILLINLYPQSNTKLVFDNTEEHKYGYNPTVNIRLNTERLLSLGWHAEVDLPEMYQRMIQSILNRCF